MKGFTYKSYNFVDRDPIIDEIRTVYQDSGVNYKWVHENSGVATATLANWFDGKTKRPQAATINAVLRSLGFKLGVTKHAEPIRIFPALPQPKHRETVRHVVQMAKYRRGR